LRPWGHADPDRGPLSARTSVRAPLVPCFPRSSRVLPGSWSF